LLLDFLVVTEQLLMVTLKPLKLSQPSLLKLIFSKLTTLHTFSQANILTHAARSMVTATAALLMVTHAATHLISSQLTFAAMITLLLLTTPSE